MANSPAATRTGVTILVVEDSPTQLDELRFLLEDAGHSVVATTNGKEGLAAVKAHAIDLVISDVVMPEMDGFALCKALRAGASTQQLPVILLTSFVDPRDVIEGLESGANNFISKPYDHPALLGRVQNVLANQELRKTSASEMGISIFFAGQRFLITADRLQILDLLLSTYENAVNHNKELMRTRDELRVLNEQLETQVGARTKQLEVSGEELKLAHQTLLDRGIEIQNFYHTLSHELKTPLTSARDFLCIVLDGLAGPLSKTQAEYLGIAKESCDQLRLYINDLLDVTRLETGKMSIVFEPRSVAALIERVVAMLAPAAAAKGIALSAECEPDLPAIPIDEPRILQVLSNLTTNALKFTRTGGVIRLILSRSSTDPECVQVAVRDTGVGISKKDLGRVFGRLYQADKDDSPTEIRSGLGLGLYICQELVALHGGRIWVQSTPGVGSTFTFTLPTRRAPSGSYVLVVDDDAVLASALHDFLEDAGYRVAIAADGSEALVLVRQQHPAVIILDLRMAGMDGLETMREIRKQDTWIPVIVHTGYPDSDMMSSMLEFSPFTVLAKPSQPETILDAVRDAESQVRRARK